MTFRQEKEYFEKAKASFSKIGTTSIHNKQNGYYPILQLPSWFTLPQHLHEIILKLWENSYKELYEEGVQTISLQHAINKVLDAFEAERTFLHKRLVYMGLAFGIAAQSTIRSYLPQESRTKILFQKIYAWVSSSQKYSPLVEEDISHFQNMIYAPQALSEACLVFKYLQQAMNDHHARPAIVEIIDICLEGYAIFPGSEGRRDLFNWWLLAVIPAAYNLRLPEKVYTLKWPWPTLSSEKK